MSAMWLPSWRSWLALLFVVFVYLTFDHVAHTIASPLSKALELPVAAPGELMLLPYALLMVVRLMLDALVVGVICTVLRRRLFGPPLIGPGLTKLTVIGFATGFAVMVCAIFAIVAVKDATVEVSAQSPLCRAVYGAGWLVSDFIGATGEELFGRVAILIVAERFVGWRGAVIVSGLMFSILHLGNPGASWIWLARLFFQGALLAYAVYRTASVWWSVGYHTGWNWASAPLFGAAGSGYLDEGHLLEFKPTGSLLITGGAVGPEGSIFAFAAVLCALLLLLAVTQDQRRSVEPSLDAY